MRNLICVLLISVAAILASGCSQLASLHGQHGSANDPLVGAWRGKVQFKSGSLAAVKDLQFIYVFNKGGTMTESSNYDAAPPVPPAYGVWRMVQPGEYEAKYEFFSMKAPKTFEELSKGGGWAPGGSGTLFERITLSEDGKSFKSAIRYDGVDETGKPTESGSMAETEVTRIQF